MHNCIFDKLTTVHIPFIHRPHSRRLVQPAASRRRRRGSRVGGSFRRQPRRSRGGGRSGVTAARAQRRVRQLGSKRGPQLGRVGGCRQSDGVVEKGEEEREEQERTAQGIVRIEKTKGLSFEVTFMIDNVIMEAVDKEQMWRSGTFIINDS